MQVESVIWFSSTWRHERYVVVLVDDGARDVGVEDVEAEGEDPQLDQPVVPLRLLRRPPTDDAQGYVEDGRQALNQISTSTRTLAMTGGRIAILLVTFAVTWYDNTKRETPEEPFREAVIARTRILKLGSLYTLTCA